MTRKKVGGRNRATRETGRGVADRWEKTACGVRGKIKGGGEMGSRKRVRGGEDDK